MKAVDIMYVIPGIPGNAACGTPNCSCNMQPFWYYAKPKKRKVKYKEYYCPLGYTFNSMYDACVMEAPTTCGCAAPPPTCGCSAPPAPPTQHCDPPQESCTKTYKCKNGQCQQIG